MARRQGGAPVSQPKKLSENKEWILLGHYAEAMEKVADLIIENKRLKDEVERLKSMLSMSQAIAEACGEPQGDGAITVKAATSTGKTVLTDIAAKEGGRK